MDVSSTPIPAERAGDDVELLAPTNSTLEIRIARRPWLFERLTKPSPPPSVKMNPPRPPVETVDPPTAKQFAPKRYVPAEGDGIASSLPPSISNPSKSDDWVVRGSDSEPHSSMQSEQRTLERRDTTSSGTEYADVISTPRETAEHQEAGTHHVETDSMSVNATGTTRSDQEHPPDNEEPAYTEPDYDAPANEESAIAADEATGGQFVSDEDPLPLVDPIDEDERNHSEEVLPGLLDTEQELDTDQDAQDGVLLDELPDSDSPDSEESMNVESEEAFSDDVDSLTEDEVTVRKLRINRDGTPVEASDDDSAGQDSDEELSRNLDQGASVGDLAEDMPIQGGADHRALEDTATPAADLDYTGHPRTQIRMTNSAYRMQGAMKQCLRYYYARPENANERSNWGMLHSIMVFGADTKILAGNKSYSAIAWIAGNNPCRGYKLIEERDGHIAATSGIGLQGHQAQLLAILSLCDVPTNYPLYAGDRRFTVQDLVEEEMLACRSGEELTFTLIGLSHYLDTDTVWTNGSGETWSFERLLREELAQPIVGAACGGTHRLMGYAHALRKRRAEGRPLNGQWKRAEIYSQDFIRYVYRLQNRDGSMSTDWFEGREDNGDLDRKIQTTGHMVEWLLTVTPDSELHDQRLVNAVRFLLSSMYNDRTHEWKIGPKGHALRSLAMYYERVYQQGPAWRSTDMATGQSNQRR